ncbi:hypothetical protein KC343_g6754 [Hortaea werneckii]|nr:hypothetical protein KC352_g14021 [Hortaea werneckii]KAI7564576.1 hypothetical protein KC317_g6969 [Hortaea werneckii]KAI7615114.1 hypothetical protein KC346_g6629 [Hortaea werneckii]KAI7625113.1 hypothetical protein KC343_g6754 [Hortaea werneckii]KAI7667681.1 hypothetical protein KC319_g6603 [Hortaea werneckii]
MPFKRRIKPLALPALTTHTVRIGRWAPNVSYPHHDYLDPASETATLVHITRQEQFRHIYEQENGGGMNLSGTVLASGSYNERESSRNEICTEFSEIHQLDNPEAWFVSAIQRPENQTWIEEALKTYGEVYMIIGYQLVRDARVQGQNVHNKGSSFTVQAPGTAAVAAATGIPLLGDALDPSAGGDSIKRQASQQSFTLPGEQVVAIQYRRIRFRFFSSRHVERKHLDSKTMWKYVWDMRERKDDPENFTEAVDDCECFMEAYLAYEDADDEDDDADDVLDVNSGSDD